MLYNRSDNERALNRLFSEHTDLPQLNLLTVPVTYIIHFSPRDVSILRQSALNLIENFLPPDWYDVGVVAQQMETTPASSLGALLKTRLEAITTSAIIPIHAEDFFACERLGAFQITLGEMGFNVLGRRLMHEIATSNFIDEGRLGHKSLAELTQDDFIWLFERAFTVSQQRSVVTTYSDAIYSAHVPLSFDTWRREPSEAFIRYFRKLSLDFEGAEATNPEPMERSGREKQLANWFADRLRAQASQWNEVGWPEL
ncbi:hypothetical protein SLH49_14940 [Cognatiyoonia sp. IB215446]|uniref:hypothetical protein n=1 Tax=Cognatiyoonia sp. IB215446 TaxID=3097355 RepID=UPI002A0F433E|nr:hypothetical protein [Cognatiyoonia sp. IB215446]MDX8349281.1 hypothetical protein [Cognatiyoonia sp. IB215446]